LPVAPRPQPDEPTAQLTLFKLGRYHYQVLVTNLPLQPLNLWRFYNDRASVELLTGLPSPRRRETEASEGGIPRYGSARDRGSYGLLAIVFLGTGAAHGGS
jgi:hypothetical protein